MYEGLQGGPQLVPPWCKETPVSLLAALLIAIVCPVLVEFVNLTEKDATTHYCKNSQRKPNDYHISKCIIVVTLWHALYASKNLIGYAFILMLHLVLKWWTGSRHLLMSYCIRFFDIALNVYQTNHAIGWNRSRDLFQPIAWFVWYTFNAMSKHLIGSHCSIGE